MGVAAHRCLTVHEGHRVTPTEQQFSRLHSNVFIIMIVFSCSVNQKKTCLLKKYSNYLSIRKMP